MRPSMVVVLLAASLISAAGCHMCQHPYDSCGPVYSRGECQNCNEDYRAGSILNRSRASESYEVAGEVRKPQAVRVARNPQPRPARTMPAPTAARPIAAHAHRSPTRAPAVQPTLQPSAEPVSEDQKAKEEAVFVAHLPSGTVLAPPGTKAGATKVLSVTDKRLDEATPANPPLVADRRAIEPSAERPTSGEEGWRPVGARHEPTGE